MDSNILSLLDVLRLVSGLRKGHADDVVPRPSSAKEDCFRLRLLNLDFPRLRILRYFGGGFLHLRLTTLEVVAGGQDSTDVRKLEKPSSRCTGKMWKIVLENIDNSTKLYLYVQEC